MASLEDLAGRRVCFLNWRDRSHPEAGGAEVYTEELARRFAAAGVYVTLLTAAHGEAPIEEVRDGIRIRRRGGTFGVYGHAAERLRHARGRYDAVVDFQNGIPFFAPLFTGRRTPVVMVVHHVHQDQFRYRFRWPLSAFGRWLESSASRRVYGTRPVVAVSPSTRKEVRLRLGLRGPIHVVPNGIDEVPRVGDRSLTPTIAVVTRLAPHKRLHLLVEAVAELRFRWPDLHLHLAGRGAGQGAIEDAISRHGLADHVTLHGFVTEQERAALLSQAWVTALPSEAEGWGLTILEANSLGVPAVALRVPGIRDSVIEDRTGWLAGDVHELPTLLDMALRRLSDPAEAAAWARRCQEWASSFSWDKSAEALARVLVGELRGASVYMEDSRRHPDVSIKVSFEIDDDIDLDQLIRRLDRGLRATDLVMNRDGRVTLLLHGTDEALAFATLRRLGVQAPLTFAVVHPHERLTGLGDSS